MSDPDPLASFEPQLIDGRLQLTVRHLSTVALYAGLAAFYAIGFGGGFLWNARDLLEQGMAGTVLAIGGVAALVALVAYFANWMATTTLLVGTESLRWGGIGYRRHEVDGFSLQRPHLNLYVARSTQSLTLLRHDREARSALLQLLQTWKADPAWDPNWPLWFHEAPSLDARLAPLQPTLKADGYRIPLRSRGEVGPHIDKIIPLFLVLPSFSYYLGLAWVLVGPYWLWRILARGSVVLAPGGFTIGGGARIHWSQVDTATLDEAGDVQVVLIDGTKHTLRPLYPVGASALAQVITERTLPNQTASEVPTPLHQARRAASRETL